MSKADVIVQVTLAIPLLALMLIPPRKRRRRS
jgi:hypothetical protein